MKIKFWGVRGSVPTPMNTEMYMSRLQAVVQRISPKDLESVESRIKFIANLPTWLSGIIGGNTACVELRISDDTTFIFDCGTGIIGLGKEIFKTDVKKIHIFLSHYHWDHIQGLPFFDPIYAGKHEIHFYAVKDGLKEIFEEQMKSPEFPVDFKNLENKFTFHKVEEGVPFTVEGYRMNTKKMFHPDDSFAYSVEKADGKKFIYATDAELKSTDFEKNDKDDNFFLNADVLVLDAQYTVEEALEKENWGHSTFCYAVDFASSWNVKRLFLFHHEPQYNDKKIYSILESAKWYANYGISNTLDVDLAVEGLELDF